MTFSPFNSTLRILNEAERKSEKYDVSEQGKVTQERYGEGDIRRGTKKTTDLVVNEAGELIETVPKPIRDVVGGVANVTAKGLLGYTDEEGNVVEGLLNQTPWGPAMNPLGKPSDLVTGTLGAYQSGVEKLSDVAGVNPIAGEFLLEAALGGVLSRVGRFKPTPSTFRGAAAAIENLPPETLFKIDLPSILNQTPGGSYAFMSTTKPLVGRKLKPEMANLNQVLRKSQATGYTKGIQVDAPVYTPKGSILQEIAEGNVKTTRDAYGFGLGSTGTTYTPPWNYKIKGTFEAPRGGQATVWHHIDELSRSGKPILMHRSSMGIQLGENTPLAKYLRNKHKLDIGHDEFNITHILDWQPKKQRNATVRAIQNQLGGADNIHFSTINDLEGGTALKSVDITQPGEVVPGSRGKVISEGASEVLPTTKDYPTVKVRHPGTGEVLDTLKFSNPNEWAGRYKTVLAKYRELGFNVPETFNRKAIKTSPNLAMRGTDHVVTHRILDGLTEIPGNPLYEVDQLIKHNKINSLSVEELGDLLAAQNQLEHQVAAHVLKNRYKLIVEYHDKVIYPKGQRTLAGRSRWKDLDVDARRRFFLEHVDHLAVRGGVFNNQNFMKNPRRALRPIKNWDQGITDIFNIKPPRSSLK